MKLSDIVKGLGLYLVIRELSRQGNTVNNNPGQTPEFNWNRSPKVSAPQSHYAPPTLDIRSIVEEAFKRTFEKPRVTLLGDYNVPSLLEPQTTKPSPDPQTIEAGKWLVSRSTIDQFKGESGIPVNLQLPSQRKTPKAVPRDLIPKLEKLAKRLESLIHVPEPERPLLTEAERKGNAD